MAEKALVWFRDDLRVADNPALSAALAKKGEVRALYVLETDHGLRPLGGAARWWLHHSLVDLAASLAALGVELDVIEGKSADAVEDAAAGSGAVFWNHRYAPAARAVDDAIAARLARRGVSVETFSANVLVEPDALTTREGKPYSVFTPFSRALRKLDVDRPLPRPRSGGKIAVPKVDGDYRTPFWAKKFVPYWSIGEKAAAERLADFLDEQLAGYAKGRDVLARDATSRLSPHLRFGEISPRQIWHAVQSLSAREPKLAAAADKFLTELSWRDFNINQLYHRPDIARQPMQPKYAGMPWRKAPAEFERWTGGQTGFPIVDAGMRELWETGYMHNRVRMIVASLLAKNMMIDWRDGEDWFWDCLMDADPANNPGNWQWVAGSGLDAAPYFRIYNPISQGERFDPEGDYVRRWVPELADLPNSAIHKPFGATADVLHEAGVALGKTYPQPVVDLKESRDRALAAFKAL